jgi:hypothetical protein
MDLYSLILFTWMIASPPVMQTGEDQNSEAKPTMTDEVLMEDVPRPEMIWYPKDRFGTRSKSGKLKPRFDCMHPGHKSEHRSASSLKKCEDYQAVVQAQQWIAAQQKKGGRWMCETQGGGHEIYDVGVTGLAMLALQGYGNTLNEGEYQENLRNGVHYLTEIQSKRGNFGMEAGQANPFNHALATMALCEAYAYGDQPLELVEPIRRAVQFIEQCRNPYSGWRYAKTPNGMVDSVSTAWMASALLAAKGAGFKVDEQALQDADGWFQGMTGESGRVGYTMGFGGGPGGSAFRYSKPFDISKVSTSGSEGITAGALAVRLLQQAPTDGRGKLSWKDASYHSELDPQLGLLLNSLPRKDSVADLHYWYWASTAVHQYGEDAWAQWRTALHDALMARRLEDGSWSTESVWAPWGGRIYTTAMATVILTTEMRYLPAEERAKPEFKRLKDSVAD